MNTKFNPDIHHRHSVRLQNYDYSQAGLYFITLCVQNRECIFGEITDGKIRLKEIGEIAQNCWLEIPQHYPDTGLHNFVVMPNHIHGIIEISANVGVQNFEPLRHQRNEFQHIIPRSIGAIIRGFKIGVTKQIGHSVFQRNLWEHIIRDATDYARIDDYITNNPFRWKEDTFYNE